MSKSTRSTPSNSYWIWKREGESFWPSLSQNEQKPYRSSTVVKLKNQGVNKNSTYLLCSNGSFVFYISVVLLVVSFKRHFRWPRMHNRTANKRSFALSFYQTLPEWEKSERSLGWHGRTVIGKVLVNVGIRRDLSTPRYRG